MADKPKKKPQQDYQQLARKVLDSVISKGESTPPKKAPKAKRRPQR